MNGGSSSAILDAVPPSRISPISAMGPEMKQGASHWLEAFPDREPGKILRTVSSGRESHAAAHWWDSVRTGPVDIRGMVRQHTANMRGAKICTCKYSARPLSASLQQGYFVLSPALALEPQILLVLAPALRSPSRRRHWASVPWLTKSRTQSERAVPVFSDFTSACSATIDAFTLTESTHTE